MFKEEKIVVPLLEKEGTRDGNSMKWSLDINLRGVSSSISVIVFDTTEKKVSQKTGGEYFVSGGLVIPNMNKNIPLFYNEKYNFSSASIGSGNDEVKFALNKKGTSFRDQWTNGGAEVKVEKDYLFTLKFMVEETTSTESAFGSDVVETTTSINSPVEDVKVTPTGEAGAKTATDNDLPF